MSNLKLYQIEQDYINLAEQIIDAGGEVSEEQNEALQINKNQLENKARGFGFVILDLESEISIIENEVKRLQQLKVARVKTVEKLKEKISDAMQLFEISEVKTATIKLSFRRSESVEIDNVDLLDATYKVEKVSITANKVKIKEDIKSGISVMGAVLQINQNLQIK